MIVVTGAAGFIGSCMIQSLHEAGYTDILAVDDFSHPEKARNLEQKKLWVQEKPKLSTTSLVVRSKHSGCNLIFLL